MDLIAGILTKQHQQDRNAEICFMRVVAGYCLTDKKLNGITHNRCY